MTSEVYETLKKEVEKTIEYDIESFIPICDAELNTLALTIDKNKEREKADIYLNEAVNQIIKSLKTDEQTIRNVFEGEKNFNSLGKVSQKLQYALQSQIDKYQRLLDIENRILKQNNQNLEDKKNLEIMEKSYAKFNLIGEKLRGREVKYDITLVVEDQKTEIYSGIFSLEEILGVNQKYRFIKEVGGKEPGIKLNVTKDFREYLKNKKNEKLKKWTYAQIQKYKKFIELLKKNETEEETRIWKKKNASVSSIDNNIYYNRGNAMEAYKQMLQNNIRNSLKNVEGALRTTLKNTGSYITGGDLFQFIDNEKIDTQLKVITEKTIIDEKGKEKQEISGASFTDLNSLYNQWYQLRKILEQLKGTGLTLNNLKTASISDDEIKQKAVQQFIDHFGLGEK